MRSWLPGHLNDPASGGPFTSGTNDPWIFGCITVITFVTLLAPVAPTTATRYVDEPEFRMQGLSGRRIFGTPPDLKDKPQVSFDHSLSGRRIFSLDDTGKPMQPSYNEENEDNENDARYRGFFDDPEEPNPIQYRLFLEDDYTAVPKLRMADLKEYEASVLEPILRLFYNLKN